jgi:sugar phosphate isomerase/epimerase
MTTPSLPHLCRREFLTLTASGLAAVAIKPFSAAAAALDETIPALHAPVGLQLWSLREELPKDLPGTLAKVRAMGFTQVEGAGLWKQKVADLRAALDAAGLETVSAHMEFERLRDDLPGALAEAKALGASWIVCPWIPHKNDRFTREDTLGAAETFNKVGKGISSAGLHFSYHCHGYEFIQSKEGTLFDTLAANTDAANVTFQIDVFHCYLGGGDPAPLITQYASRVKSLHLKDLKKGWTVVPGKAIAPPEADVPVGTGQLDMPAILKAAVSAGVQMYFIEDESNEPLSHIPQSVGYLRALK